ncbi:MAG: DUF362 domain-containing protein [Armatimonadia bacterium]
MAATAEPVSNSAAKAVVGVVRAQEDLVASVDQVLRLCGSGDCVHKGDRVLVKPNLHGGNGHTSPLLMEAACKWAFACGASQVTLGDGPSWGQENIDAYFEQAGVFAACEASGAKPANFHADEYELHHLDSPHTPDTLGVSRHLYEHDVVINLPVMKTHFNTLITIALKNVKGCLRPVDKRRLHECDLNRALAVVNQIISPRVTVTLCDAMGAFEGLGPSSATPVEMGLLLASADPVALDVVACQLMEIAPESVRLIQEAAAAGVGVADPEQIKVVGERVADHARHFLLPHEALAASFPGLTIHSAKACSCCMQNLFQALEQVQRSGREPAFRRLLIGPGPTTEADLLIGKCAAEGRDCRPDVAGCPPPMGHILAALCPEEAS